MTKKMYMKPAVMTVDIDIMEQVVAISIVGTDGLDQDGLNFNNGTGDLDDAMVKGNHNVWDDEW